LPLKGGGVCLIDQTKGTVLKSLCCRLENTTGSAEHSTREEGSMVIRGALLLLDWCEEQGRTTFAQPLSARIMTDNKGIVDRWFARGGHDVAVSIAADSKSSAAVEMEQLTNISTRLRDNHSVQLSVD
jgi:hypothetical protein